jgi:hypothetical protein
MTNDMQIQTVHGVTHPTVAATVTDENEAAEPPSTQLYREETAERLMESNRAAASTPSTKTSGRQQ